MTVLKSQEWLNWTKQFAQIQSQLGITLSGTAKLQASMVAMWRNVSGVAKGALGVSVLLTAIGLAKTYADKVEQAKEAARSAAIEASRSFDARSKSAEEYKKQIAELRKQLDYGNLSEQESYDIREQLIGIQDDVIANLGKEAGAFDVLRDSVSKTNDVLDSFTKSEAITFLTEHSDALDEAVRKMEATSGYQIRVKDSSQIRNILSEVFGDSLGEYRAKDRRGNYVDGNYITFTLGVDARDVDTKLSEVNARLYELEQSGIDVSKLLGVDSWEKTINQPWKKAKNVIQDYGENYDAYIQNTIRANETLLSLQGKLADGEKAYNEALLETDPEKKAQAIQEAYESILALDFSDVDDESVQKYFDELVAAFIEKSKSEIVRIQLKVDLDTDDSYWRKAIRRELDAFRDETGKVDLLDVQNTGNRVKTRSSDYEGWDAQESAYLRLKAAADHYGISIEDLIDNLVDLGEIAGKVGPELEGVLGGKAASIDTLDKVKDAASSLNEAFKDVKENGSVSFDSLKKISDAFSEKDSSGNMTPLIDGLDEYTSKLAEVRNDVPAVTSIINEMTDKFIEAKLATDDLAASDVNQLEAALKAGGIENAHAVAVDRVAQAKIDAAIANGTLIDSDGQLNEQLVDEISDLYASGDAAEAAAIQKQLLAMQTALASGDIAGFIAALGAESNASDSTKRALVQLATQIITTGNTGLNTSQQIQALQELGIAAINTASNISSVASALAGLSGNAYVQSMDALVAIAEAVGVPQGQIDALISGSALPEDMYRWISEQQKTSTPPGGVVPPTWAYQPTSTSDKTSATKKTPLELLKESFDKDKEYIEAEIAWREHQYDEYVRTGQNDLAAENIKERMKLYEELKTLAENSAATARSLNISEDEIRTAGFPDTWWTAKENQAELAEQIAEAFSRAKESIDANLSHAQNELDLLVSNGQYDNLADNLNEQVELYQQIMDGAHEAADAIRKYLVEELGWTQEQAEDAVAKTGLSDTWYEARKNILALGDQIVDAYKEAAEKIDAEITQTRSQIEDLIESTPFSTAGGTNLRDEYRELYDEYVSIMQEAEELGVDLSKTVYGNIDTNNRQVLEWTEENLERFRDALESWGEDVDELRGSISTVYGSAGEYDGIDIAFSPILQTADGPVLLDADTVDRYIFGLIERAGEGWTNEKLLSLDAEGLEIDGVKIQGLIADIGETAIDTSAAMHFTGVDGAVNGVRRALEELGTIYPDIGESITDLLRKLDGLNTKSMETAHSFADIYRGFLADRGLSQEEIENAVERAGFPSDYFAGKKDNRIKEVAWYADTFQKESDIIQKEIDLLEHQKNAAIERKDLDEADRISERQQELLKQRQDRAHHYAELAREILRNAGYSEEQIEQIIRDLGFPDSWWKDQESVLDKAKEKVENLQSALDELTSALDEFQNVYQTLLDAADEYESTGFLSAKSVEAILQTGPQYLQFLYDENGQLKINEESLQRVIAAKTEEMAVETSRVYLEKILYALDNNKVEDLKRLADVTDIATDSTWGLVDSLLGEVQSYVGLGELSQEYYNNIASNIQKLKQITKATTGSMSAWGKSLHDGYVSQEDAVQQLFDIVQEMVKWELDKQVEALEDQKKKYDELIDKRIKLLELAKKETDHNKTVEKKLKEIAKLQAKIDLLSLDKSREAQAKRAKLMEELAEKQSDLDDTQSEYFLDVQKQALSDEKEAYDKEKDKEIKKLKETLDSTQELYDVTLNKIQTAWNEDWDGFYSRIISWNGEWGSNLTSTIQDVFSEAGKAYSRFNGDVEATMKGVKSNTAIDVPGITTDATSSTTAKSQIDTSSAESRTPEIKMVKGNGEAPSNMQAGDYVVTGGGLYQITDVNDDGSYNNPRLVEEYNLETMEQVRAQWLKLLGGMDTSGASVNISSPPSSPTLSASEKLHEAPAGAGREPQIKMVKGNGEAPMNMSAGDYLVTGGGLYRITGVNKDGTYQNPELIEKYNLGTMDDVWEKYQKVLRNRSRLPGFSSGGVVDFTGPAMLHGTKANPETILNYADMSKVYDLIHNTPSLAGTMVSSMIEKMREQSSKWASLGDTITGGDINNNITVNLVQNGPSNDADDRKHARKIAEYTLGELREAMSLKGMRNITPYLNRP